MLVRQERWRFNMPLQNVILRKSKNPNYEIKITNQIYKIEISTLFQMGFGIKSRNQIEIGCFNLLFFPMRC